MIVVVLLVKMVLVMGDKMFAMMMIVGYGSAEDNGGVGGCGDAMLLIMVVPRTAMKAAISLLPIVSKSLYS